MIASVVATLEIDSSQKTRFLMEVGARPEFEYGDFPEGGSRVPITIDAKNRHDMEEYTTWLRTRPGVLMVDIVFVHLEDTQMADGEVHAS